MNSEMVLQSIKLKVEKFKIVNSSRFTLKKIKLVNRLAKQHTIDQTKLIKIIINLRLKIHSIKENLNRVSNKDRELKVKI